MICSIILLFISLSIRDWFDQVNIPISLKQLSTWLTGAVHWIRFDDIKASLYGMVLFVALAFNRYLRRRKANVKVVVVNKD